MATTKSAADSRHLLWTVLVLVALAAVALWAASAVSWVQVHFTTPFSGEKTASLDGSRVRPELTPLALASLAAGAAVLAASGLLRRLIGLLMVAAAGLLCWRAMPQDFGWFTYAGSMPPGSRPTGEVAVAATGPLLTAAAGLALAVAGLLVVFRARRMPGMGARYSAPGAAKEGPRDPDRQLWDALDADEDPTDDDRER